MNVHRSWKILLLWFPFFLPVFGLKAQPNRLYIANDDHTDYMWTANEQQYDSAFVHMLDYYLAQIEATKKNPDDFQARFNCDGIYWLKVYEKYRSKDQFQQLIKALHSGHISAPLNTLVSTYGAQPTEAVIRGMFDAGKLERRFGLRFRMAVCMENQTLPLGLSALWAGSGARYSWRGVCGCATKMAMPSFRNRRHQLYHYTGLDGSGVLMKWYSLGSHNTYLGGYAEARGGEKPKDTLVSIISMVEDLDKLITKGSLNGTYPHKVAGAFGYGWDDLATFVSPAFIKAAQLTTNPNRRVRVSNEEDFFRDVEKNYPNLPKEIVSYGNEWDLYCASMNETTAKVRRATEQLRNAEALAAVSSLRDTSYLRPLHQLRERAWEAYGLYWEHDWTADGPVSRADRASWQIKMQQRISAYSDTLLALSITALGDQIRKATQPQFFVFNSLNWVRSDFADFKYDGPYPVKVIDVASGREVPSQLMIKGTARYLRILATEVPSVGFKKYELRPGNSSYIKPAAQISADTISNQFYQIRFSPSGVLTEWYDRMANRQIIQSINGKHVNDLGTSNIERGAQVTVENAGPVSITLKAVSNDPVPHTVRLTLFADIPRILIEDSIQANFSDVKSWAFSFALKKATTRHEELGAILTAKTESKGGHYASENARYDWLTFNHYANISEANYGVTLSNLDCSFFKLGQSTSDSLWDASTQINALAGGQIDNQNNPEDSAKGLGIYKQNGTKDFFYQFALGTHHQKFDPVASMKFSLEHTNPLVTGWVTGTKEAKFTNQFSLLSVANPQVILWSVKPAEEGSAAGLVTRFWNLSAEKETPAIRFASPIRSAWHTSHIETDENKLTTRGSLLVPDMNQHQLKTFRVVLQ